MKNGVILQGFEWYLPDDGNYYKDMMTKASEIKVAGFSSVWLPPVCKGTGTNDVGYGIYDLYDLGEFDQNGSVRTKYGTKEDLHELLEALKHEGLDVYADIVLNHKAGGDRLEQFKAVEVDPNDRTTEIGQPRDIKSWTAFDFPGRDGKYSQFKWYFNHFNGVGYDDLTGEHGIYKILGKNKGWSLDVSPENGNFDYLMFSDIDHAHPDVKEELKNWVQWFIQETGVRGFRIDAVKHIDANFFRELTENIKDAGGEDFYLFCEYWTDDIELIKNYVEETQHQLDLFDISLHYNLQRASEEGDRFDLRTIFDGTIVQTYPTLAVTFVDNHDTQPRQSLQSWVAPWFKEMAYALILLRKDGYPCVFYGDYFGIDSEEDYKGVKDEINRLMFLRQRYCYGDQDDYFQEPNLIGWVRHGDEEHPTKAAIVLSNKEGGTIRMFVGQDYAGKTFIDQMEWDENQVTIQDDGFGEFSTPSAGLSVWIEEEDTMITKNDLLQQLEASNINTKGTLMVHSSMKAIGQVDGGPVAVIDALCQYMSDGLLLLPTHSWEDWNLKDNIFNVKTEKSCVGLLTNTFLLRDDVVRSLHPTHSVAAYGRRKTEYTDKDKTIIQKGDVLTPCPREGCFGSLYDEDSQILFIGATLQKNTYIHSIEEWLSVPERLAEKSRTIKVIDYDGTSYDVNAIPHNNTLGSVSKNYDRIESALFEKNIATTFTLGNATCILLQVKEMTEFVLEVLKDNPNYFGFE